MKSTKLLAVVSSLVVVALLTMAFYPNMPADFDSTYFQVSGGKVSIKPSGIAAASGAIGNLNGLGTNVSLYGTVNLPGVLSSGKGIPFLSAGSMQAIANLEGWLHNDGSGNFIWSTPTGGTTVENTYVTDQHFSGKTTFNQVIITNGFFAQTNLWSGPSNNVDVSIYDQEYSTVTPVQFNGIINSSNSLGGEVKMTIKNASSSNITLYAVAGFVFANGDTTETITNGHRGICWVNHDPALGGQTNLVFQSF